MVTERNALKLERAALLDGVDQRTTSRTATNVDHERGRRAPNASRADRYIASARADAKLPAQEGATRARASLVAGVRSALLRACGTGSALH